MTKTASDYYKELEEISKLMSVNIAKEKLVSTYEERKKLSDEYNLLNKKYKRVAKQYDVIVDEEYNERKIKETRLNIGDRVENVSLGMFGVARFTGEVALNRGRVKIRLDEKYQGKRHVPISMNWKKIRVI